MKGMDGKNWNIREHSIRYKEVSIRPGKKKTTATMNMPSFFL